MPRRARHVLLLSLIAVLALPAAGASAAGIITRENPGDQIDYEAVGAANVVITDAPQGAGTLVTVAEAGISLAVGTDECTDLGNLVTCAFAYPDEGRIDLAGSALGDTFDGRALTRTVMSAMGNDGNDVIRGGNTVADPEGNDLGDSLNGGEDVDQIFGGDGNDFLTALRDGGELGEGGPGDDNFISLGGGATGDTMRGGPGFDQIWMRASPGIQSFTIDLAAQTVIDQAGLDAPDVIEGFEDVRTDEGNDILLGTAGFDVLRSGDGNDRIDGRLGADVAFGEAGADRLEARDGVVRPAHGRRGRRHVHHGPARRDLRLRVGPEPHGDPARGGLPGRRPAGLHDPGPRGAAARPAPRPQGAERAGRLRRAGQRDHPPPREADAARRPCPAGGARRPRAGPGERRARSG